MTEPVQRREFSVAVLTSCLLPDVARAQPVVPLEIGLLPNISARTLLNQYQPLREFLARTLQRPVLLSTAPDWATFHNRVAATLYDLVVTAPHLARLAQLDHGWSPLLQWRPDVKGLVVFATARPIASIAELRGKALVLSNPLSLVALQGTQWLAGKGLRRDHDFSVIRIPTDDSVGNVLLRGDAVAAMLSATEFRAIPDELRRQLQVLAEFADLPGLLMMVCPRIVPDQARLIKTQLLSFAQAPSADSAAFLAATGFYGMREVPQSVLESMDIYMKVTREMLVKTP
jgi:phosphonate transport system substrate-binding protein